MTKTNLIRRYLNFQGASILRLFAPQGWHTAPMG